MSCGISWNSTEMWWLMGVSLSCVPLYRSHLRGTHRGSRRGDAELGREAVWGTSAPQGPHAEVVRLTHSSGHVKH